MKYAKASSGEFPTLDGNTEWNRCVTVKKTVIPTNLILNVRLVGIMANSSGANGYCIFSLGITPTVALRSTPYDTPHD